MTVTLDIPKEIEARLLADAQTCGVPPGELVREFIIDHYARQLRKNLGLDS